jgi:hypothetical protein
MVKNERMTLKLESWNLKDLKYDVLLVLVYYRYQYR